MNIGELAKIIEVKVPEEYEKIRFLNIKTNTKELGKNDIFLAINSGHNYLNEIKSCKGVIVENDFKTTKFPVFKVNNTKEALEKIAIYKRNKYTGKIIAITGSNGKTTTKELMSHVLNKKYKIFKSKQNMNNKLGVLINLLSIEKSEFAIFELGMNHEGEISYLSKLLKPDIAIITNIGTAHIGNLGSKKNIYKAKLEILDGMNNNALFVNGEDKYLSKCNLAHKVRLKNDLFQIDNINEYSDYISFDLKIDKICHIKYHVPALVQLSNVALVVYVAINLGVKYAKIVKALNGFKSVKSRMEVVKLKDKIVINDSYNSNYESLIAGIACLKNYSLDKICIIGSILELGQSENTIYKRISNNLNMDYFYIFVGNKIRAKHAIYLDNVDSLIEYYYQNQNLFKDKVIYVKGSHAVNLIKFVSEITN